jgi:hypothetical protein
LNAEIPRIIRAFSEDESVIRPTTRDLDAVDRFVLIPSREAMTEAVLSSEVANITRLPVSRFSATDDADTKQDAARGSACAITVRFLGDSVFASRLSRSIWALTTAIESIDGTRVVVEDLGRGSIWIRLKVFCRSIWVKDRVRELLNSGVRAAAAYFLQKPLAETQRIDAERAKLEKETELIEQQLQQRVDSSHQELMGRLELMGRAEEVRGQRLTNDLKALDVVKRASELIKDSIITAEKVRIDFDGMLAFLYDGQAVESRPLGAPPPEAAAGSASQ